MSEENICGCGHEEFCHYQHTQFCRMNGCKCDEFTPCNPIKNVCGNSNMRNLTEEDRRKGRSHKCSQDDPCDQCSQEVKE